MHSIEIKNIGITKLAVDAIVNAANERLWEGGGVCGAIFREAGSAELTKACNAIGGCKTGNAVITPVSLAIRKTGRGEKRSRPAGTL